MPVLTLAVCRQPPLGGTNTPAAPPTQDKLQEEIDLFRDIFVGRDDCVFSTLSSTKKDNPITDDVLRSHLQGQERIGVYQLTRATGITTGPYDHAKWACIDFDNPNDVEQAQRDCDAVRTELSHLGLTSYTEVSKSKGFHCWIFFVEARPASEVQEVCKGAVTASGLKQAPEIFPKQTRVEESGYGSLVNLPDFGAHDSTKQTILDTGTNTPVSRERFLHSVVRHDYQDLNLALAKIRSRGTGTPPASSIQPAVSVTNLFAPQIKGNRNNTTFNVARHLKGKGLSQADAVEICKSLNNGYQPPQPTIDVYRTVKSVYSNSAMTTTPVGQLTAVTAGAFMAQHAGQKLTFHIQPLLRTSGSLVIFGKTGVGKSTVAMQMAFAMAAGKQCLGLPKPASAQKILYLDGENGAEVINARLHLAGDSYKGTPAEHNLYICLADGIFRFDDNYNRPGLTQLRALLAQHQINVLVLDSLQNFCNAPENDADKMRPAFDALKRSCVATGTAIIVIHHTNKSMDQAGIGSMRGSSTIGDWAESIVHLKQLPDDTLKAVTEKCRNSYKPDPILLTRDQMSGVFTASSAPTSKQARFDHNDVVIAYNTVSASCGKKRVLQADVVKEVTKLGGSESAARRAIQASIKHGKIKINKNTNGGRYELFI